MVRCITASSAKQGEYNVFQHKGKNHPCLGILVIWINK